MGPLLAESGWARDVLAGAVGATVSSVIIIVFVIVFLDRFVRRAREREERRAEEFNRVLADLRTTSRPRADDPDIRARIDAGVQRAAAYLRETAPGSRVELRVGPEAGPDGPVVEVEVQVGDDRMTTRLDSGEFLSEHLVEYRVLGLWLALRRQSRMTHPAEA